MKGKALLFFLLLFCTSGVAQNKTNIEKIKKEVKQKLSQYKNFPNYSIQLDKGGCRVQLIGNEIPLYTVFERGGFSGLIPFNGRIIKSGNQILKIKVYPDEEKETFDDFTTLSIKIVYFENDKDPNSPRIILNTTTIPKEVIKQKMRYYEFVIPFKAEVPYDFSKELESSKKLSDLPNVEKKVLETYHKIFSWLEKGDVQSISNFRAKSDEKACLVYYFNTDESIEERFDYSPLFQDNLKPEPLPKYKIVFYGEGKLVRLEKVDNSGEVLILKGKDSEGNEMSSELNVLLYMPIGSENLEQF